MIAFLPGDPSTNDGPDAELFAQATRDTHERFIVFDIETGPSPNVISEHYGIPQDKAALDPLSGKVLLAGLMECGPVDVVKNPTTLLEHSSEASLMETLLSKLSAASPDATLTGHNILGFDLPFVLRRATLLGLADQIPAWMFHETRNRFTKRIIDTLRHIEKSRFSKCQISLTDFEVLCGRDFVSHGADFSEKWADPDFRPMLRRYNIFNLQDTASLMVALGVSTSRRLTPNRFTSPSPFDFDPAFVESIPEGALHDVEMPKSHAVASWITAPRRGLFSEGPSPSKGWKANLSDSAKLSYPHDSGRLDPRAMRIVGMVIAGPDSQEGVFNTEDEVTAIRDGLDLLAKHPDALVVDPGPSEFLVRLRLIKDGAVYTGPADIFHRSEAPAPEIVALWAKFNQLPAPQFCAYTGSDWHSFATRVSHACAITALFCDANPDIARPARRAA